MTTARSRSHSCPRSQRHSQTPSCSPRPCVASLALDYSNTHTPASLYEVFPPAEAKRLADKLEIHYTPKHGSWLNIAEIELSVLTRQCLNRRVGDATTLQAEVDAWQAPRNATHTGVNWRFTTADARIKLKRLYPSLQV